MIRSTGFSRMLLGFVLVAGLTVAISGCDKAEDVGRKVMHKRLPSAAATRRRMWGVRLCTKAEILSARARRSSFPVSERGWMPSSGKAQMSLRRFLRESPFASLTHPSPSRTKRSRRCCVPRPWEFIVVKDPAKLAALAERLPYSRVGNGAKLAIVVCGSLDNGLPGRGKEYWIHDCSAATMNLLLAAHAQGLGAVWTGVYPGEERVAAVREILSIPNGFMPLNGIPVGYPAENPPAKDKWNPAKIHYDKW